MDILISSNLERLLYLLFGSERCSALMSELAYCGRYSLTEDELLLIRESFVGYYTDEDDCAATIKTTFEKEDRLIDTHTAVAVSAAERYMNDNKANSPMLVVSTASPYKFAKDVYSSLSDKESSDDISALFDLRELSHVDIPTPLESTLAKAPLHREVIGKDEMAAATLKFALS